MENFGQRNTTLAAARSRSAAPRFSFGHFLSSLGFVRVFLEICDVRFAAVMQLSGEINAAMRAPDLAKRLADSALEPTSSDPDAFAAIIRADIDRLGKIIRQAKIKAE